MKLKKYCSKIIAMSLCTITLMGSANINGVVFASDSKSNDVLVSENANTDMNSIIEEINMSSSDVDNLYEEFVSTNEKAKLYTDGYDDISDFVNYAVSVGAIENTEEAQARMSKEGYRSVFRTAATTLKSTGHFYAGDFLNNSLNDKPSYKSYAASSTLAADIKLQAGYKDSKNAIKKAISALPSSQTTYTRVNSFNLNRNGSNTKAMDLFIALHGVSYNAKATKSSGKWSYVMTVTDRYDFKKENYKDSPIVNTVNNYAVGAQEAGAIVNFDVKILINDSI